MHHRLIPATTLPSLRHPQRFARVQIQVGAQRLAVLWSFGEFSEHAEFNGVWLTASCHGGALVRLTH